MSQPRVIVDLEGLRRWISSVEGREAIKRAVERAGKKADEFKRARIIDTGLLLRPMTR